MTVKQAKKGSRKTASANVAREAQFPFAWRFCFFAFVSFIALCAFLFIFWKHSDPQEYADAMQIADSQIPRPVHASSPLETSPPAEHVATILPQELDVERVEPEIRLTINVLTESFPDDHLAVHLAGVVYSRFKQTSLAETLLRRSLAMAPHDLQVRRDLAELLMQIGRDADAKQVLMEDWERGMAVEDFVQLLAESQVRMGELNEARDTLENGTKNFTNSARNWLSLGELQLQLNAFGQAEASLRKAIAIERESERALLALSQALNLQNKSAESAEVRQSLQKLRESSQLQKKSFEETYKLSFKRFACSTFRSIANIYQRHNDPSTAKNWLDRAHEIDPADVQTLGLLVSHYRRMRDFIQAAKVSQWIIQLQPEILPHYTNLANLYMELGDVPGALGALQLAAQKNLGQGQAHLLLAQFYLLLNQAPDAILAARKAVLENETIDAYLVLIRALEADGQSAQAKIELEKARHLWPVDPRLQQLGKQ